MIRHRDYVILCILLLHSLHVVGHCGEIIGKFFRFSSSHRQLKIDQDYILECIPLKG